MQVSYNREVGAKKTRKLVLQLSSDDVEGLPETLRQEFTRAEIALVLGSAASLIGLCARIVGARPSDLQGELAIDDDGAFTPPDNGR
jgi:hypothetical protein